MAGTGQGCDVGVAEVEAIVESGSVANDLGCGRLAGIGDAYGYRSTDSIKIRQLPGQYPLPTCK